MSKRKTSVNDVGTLAEDARALLAATSDVAGDKVAEARARLADALERGKEMYGQAKDKAIAGAKASDRFIRTNPYAAVGIGLAIGAIIGLLVARRSRDD